MGHEPSSPSGVLLHRRSHGRSRQKHYCLGPGERQAVDGVVDEAMANGFCAGRSWLGSHLTEFEINAAMGSNGVMDMSSTDQSKVSVSRTISNVDGRLGGEETLVNLVSTDEGTMEKMTNIYGQPKTTPDVPLRRSARRANSTIPSFDTFVCKNVTNFENEERQLEHVEPGADDFISASLPSSSDLDLDDLPVHDLFSVYSFLRSFSRFLFLSPFCLETLVAALRCKYANSLIDSIHFSLLHTLKPHCKFLIEEKFKAKDDCNRILNWDLLDIVTWPYFLVEYILFCDFAMRSDIKLAHYKLLDVEYYEQPTELKLRILRCLCDNAIEVESLRSVINKRVTDSDLSIDFNNNMNSLRKQKAMHGERVLIQEEIDEIADGNSNECCLCRMDGSLICCDGCPAAFHSKCVGVVKNLLPEDEWYCPECMINKYGMVSLTIPFKGADFLGRDSHGRFYSACCGYLLVSDSYEFNAFCHYYNKNDLISVIKMLKSDPSFDEIRNVISSYWDITNDDLCYKAQYEGIINNPSEISNAKIQGKLQSLYKENHGCDYFSCVGTGNTAPSISNSKNCDVSNAILPSSTVSVQFEEKLRLPADVKPVNDMLSTTLSCSSSQNNFGYSINNSSINLGNGKIKHDEQTKGEKGKVENPECISEKRKSYTFELQSDHFSYINMYSFGQVASAIAEVLLSKSSDITNKDLLTPDEVLKSDQLNTICMKFTRWCWYNHYNLMADIQNEDCGWCFTCRRSDGTECLFKVVNERHLQSIKVNYVDFSNHASMHSERKRKSHIAFAMNYILSIEHRVRSLLSGPWETPHYSEQWRTAIFEASDATPLKFLLLSLESNLRRAALSAEWLKPVDSDQTAGFTSFKPTDFHWWRGGKLLRQLSCLNMLPRSLASKACRQAGHKNILNLFYHDASEFANRSKFISWRAAVEMSENVAQLIYQVKDLDSNIKWSDILSNPIFFQFTKESKKIEKLFKQVLIRRKCNVGTEIKYLLEFGKKKVIPAIVAKCGEFLEECIDQRKRFWLSEAYVPLKLVKTFEEKRLHRKSKKKVSEQTFEKRSIIIMKKTIKNKGFSYLFSRASNSEKHLCTHCNKDVLNRDAVNCDNCDGVLHRKHFSELKGTFVTAYTCFKCKEKESMKGKLISHQISGRKRKASMARKGNLASMSKDPKKITFIMSSKKDEELSMRRIFLGKSLENKLSMAKKSHEYLVPFTRKSKGNPATLTVQCRKNPVRMTRNLNQNTISDKMSNTSRRKANNTNNLKKRKRTLVRKSRYSFLSKKAKPLKLENIVSWCKKKRTVLRYSYWLNGLLWVNDPSNERSTSFRERKVFLRYQPNDVSAQPTCCLCREDCNAGNIFIGCESCGDWFHGEAFGLEIKALSNIAGFKCSKCRSIYSPACPFSKKNRQGALLQQK